MVPLSKIIFQVRIDKMKLLFVIQGLQSGGAERVMSILCNTYASQKIQVVVALTEKNADIAYELHPSVKVVDLTSTKCTNLAKARGESIKMLRKLYKTERPDAVVSFITRTNICAILAGLGLKIPVIISERNNPMVDPRNPRTRKLRDLLYPLSAGCVFQTHYAMNCFSERIKKKSTVIFNPVSSDIYKIRNIQKREKKVVSICRLNQQKNIPLLIRAFANVSQKHPEYSLEIYGEGEEKENLLLLIDELRLTGRCYLRGHTDIPTDVLSQVEIFALSSDYEGMPNALIEALCCGCACVATDSPAYGARELIFQNENGILTEVGNVQEFSMALDLLMSDSALRHRFSLNAKQVEEKVNTERVTTMWLDFIKSKVQGRAVVG